MPESSPWVSFEPEQATKLSPSTSISSAGTGPEQVLSLPSHSSGAPGKVFGSLSSQSSMVDDSICAVSQMPSSASVMMPARFPAPS